jgi:two-component system, chemotaxis family, sensor kinase CheA
MDEIFQRFKKQFVDEILGLLESLETDLLALESNPGDSQLIDSVFRAMHTIKGSSGMYGYKHISDFTHHLESIYQSIRDSQSQINKNISDVSLASLDHIRNLINDENLTDPQNISKNEELLSAIKDCTIAENPISDNATEAATEKVDEPQIQSWYILLRTDEQLFFRRISLVGIFLDLAAIGKYHMHRIPALCNNEVETWGIVLITSASLKEIKEVFLFIEDNCNFVLLQDGDLQDEEAIQKLAETKVSETTNEKTAKTEPVNAPQDTDFTKPKLKTSLLVAEAAKHSIKKISVDSTKLDYLMYLVSELISLKSRLSVATRADQYEEIWPYIEQMEGLSKQFSYNALEIRLVPLNDMVTKFQRLVRDLSAQLDKKIDFVTQGTDTEFDKNTIDLISEPIIHIIRNCVDHGIEPPEDRIKKGKPETGTIKLSAHNAGNYINIIIEDDGAGLYLEKIREKAVKKGIIKSTDNLTKQELSNLIFHSGFSTAENITNVSGRGVGMDVVKRKMNELRGEIFIDTEKDKGTTFILKIRQSISIIDSLLFKVQKTHFIIPLTDIEICIHKIKSDLIKGQNTGTIEYNDKMIPFIDLRSHFNLGGTYPNTIKTLILKENGQYIGLLADEILGEQQAVLKPMGQAFEEETGILAASQYGNGEWAYMLNAHHLHEMLKASLTNQ